MVYLFVKTHDFGHVSLIGGKGIVICRLIMSYTKNAPLIALPNDQFLMMNRIPEEKPIIPVCYVGFTMITMAVSHVKTKAWCVFLIIEVNHGILDSIDFDMRYYCGFNIKNQQRQIIWTLLLSRTLGDIKSICAQ